MVVFDSADLGKLDQHQTFTASSLCSNLSDRVHEALKSVVKLQCRQLYVQSIRTSQMALRQTGSVLSTSDSSSSCHVMRNRAVSPKIQKQRLLPS